MILLLAVAAGGLTGLLRSRIRKQPYRVPELSWTGLPLIAVLPQLLAFHSGISAGWFSDSSASWILVISQAALLAFVWKNRQLTGMKIFGLGLALNLLVISLNRGLMPMAPETLGALFPGLPASTWEIGSRIGRGKNILLPAGETRLAFLSDALLLPAWFPWTRALSPGDLLIALGVIWLLALEVPAGAQQGQDELLEAI